MSAGITKILQSHKVVGLLIIQYEYQTDQKTKYVGKGRGAANREKTVVENNRYQITSVERNEEEIAEQKMRFGWKAFVTELDKEKLSLKDAVLSYPESRIKRTLFHIHSQVLRQQIPLTFAVF